MNSENTLKNLTFILPIGIETQDRLRNFNFIFEYLLKSFPESNFILHEIGPVNHIKDINFKNVEKIYTKSEEQVKDKFHKTWCINRALEKVKTNIVSVYDVDVLLEKKSVLDSCELLVNEFDMVLPYGYGLYQKQILNFDECLKFKNNDYDFNIFKNINLNYSFYGHVQFFKTKSYLEAGGENEDMIGYGPEDQEKLFKMNFLKYKIKYLNNSYVWHIEHERIVPTPWTTDIHNKNMDIFNNIKNMTDEERKKYYLEKKLK